VPLNTGEAGYDDTKKFSRAVSIIMLKKYPGLVTVKMDNKYRKGRVFINWQQNDASKTMVCAYSLRAAEKPFVSCPLNWKEVAKSIKQKDPAKLRFTHSDAVKRTEKYGDLLRDMLDKKQRLPAL
jgi:bifunctional non-homologous end joining protein LigD